MALSNMKCLALAYNKNLTRAPALPKYLAAVNSATGHLSDRPFQVAKTMQLFSDLPRLEICFNSMCQQQHNFGGNTASAWGILNILRGQSKHCGLPGSEHKGLASITVEAASLVRMQVFGPEGEQAVKTQSII